MIRARADDAEADAPHRDAQHEIPVAALRDPAPPGQPDRRADRDEQSQPVEVNDKRPDMDGAFMRRRDVAEQRGRILPVTPVGRSRPALTKNR